MDAAHWKRIQALFHEVADLARPAQRALLEAECPEDPALMEEVLALLEEDARSDSLLDRDAAYVADQVLEEAIPPALLEQNFGPYRLTQMLGQGGMGVVYLAERDDLGSVAAIKILRDAWLSPDRRERFASEQRALAQLNHPAIARLYDADILPDGTPWFVMEYVEGVPLTTFCDEHASPIPERLHLFRAVCEAVQHAHRHLIVHRDLKPSNILVKPDGSVKLLDFGIAKHLDSLDGPVDRTRTGLRLMTPAYAAPEQISGDPVGICTDIYTLGVVLYELLTGRLPFDLANRTPSEAERVIVEQRPERPSAAAKEKAISRRAWADLDVLCLTAMHIEPQRRYRTVEALIRDIDHYVVGEALEARPDTFGYRLGKYVRRNWRPVVVAAASSLAVVSLVGTALLAFRLRAPRAPPSVAVLYLDNLSRDTSDVYLADGLTEEITARLGKLARLRVKSRNSVRRAQSSVQGDVVTLGHALGVQYLVEGSLQRAKTRVRVSVRLVRALDGFRIWGQEYDEPTTDVLQLEQDVAGAVATAIAGQLLPTEREALAASPTRNLAAYDHYLRGNYYLAQRTPHAAERAIEEYALAARLDSDYVAALFGLADVYGSFLDYGWPYRGLAPESVLALGFASANRALRKDSTSAEAWLARRDLLVDLHPRTLDGVLEADRRAISSDPQSAHAYDEYGIDLAKLGDDSGAVAAWRRGLALDPDQPATLLRMSAIAFWQRRIQDAIRWEDSTLVVDPGFHNAYAGRGMLRLYEGDTAGARADAETALRLHTGDTLLEESLLAMIDAREGDTSAARARLRSLLQRPGLRRPAPIQATFLASAVVAIRQNTEALELLERVPRTAWFAFLLRLPYLDPLRSEVRFQRLVAESRPPRAAAP